MNELALARKAITDAVARAGDAPADALVPVVAGDSALLAATVGEPDGVTAALLKGARAFPAKAVVYQQAGDLRHLLARLDGPPAPAGG